MKFPSVNDWIFYREDPRALALARLVMMTGALLLMHSDITPYFPPSVLAPPDFHPQGVFHLLPGPLSENALSWIHKIWLLACVCALVGFRTQLSLCAAFLSGLLMHGYSHNFYRSYHHSQLFLMLIFVLAISPSGDAWSVDRLLRRKTAPEFSESYSWPLRLGQFLIVLFYGAAGFAKLSISGLSWAWSENLAFRIMESAHGTPLADFFLNQPPVVLRLLALFALAVETLAPLALIDPAWGLLFVLSWTSLHLGIFLIKGEHFAFFILIWCYVFFWASPLLQKLAPRKAPCSPRVHT